MFQYNEETRSFWFNMHCLDNSEFRLVGMVLGLAIYNGILLDVRFPAPVWKKILDEPVTLDDLDAVSLAMHAN